MFLKNETEFIMPQYAILRVTKHKTVQNLVSSLKHNFREIPTHNANPEMTKNNGHFSMKSQALANNEDEPINTTSKAMDVFNRRIEQIARNGKIRSNAVLAVEYLFTASPEWWQQSTSEIRRKWRKRTIEFLKQKHGVENIITATYQTDETTPHISAFVIPEYKGKLNARHFFGGRKILSALQTDYATQVADFGLHRGIENSKATHKTIKQYYSEINQVMSGNVPKDELNQEIRQKIHIPKKSLLETTDGYQKKIYQLVEQSVHEILAPKYAYFPKVKSALNNKQEELEELDNQKREFFKNQQKIIDEEVLLRTQNLDFDLKLAVLEKEELSNELKHRDEIISKQNEQIQDLSLEVDIQSGVIASLNIKFHEWREEKLKQERVMSEHQQAFDDLCKKLKATQLELSRYKEKYEPNQSLDSDLTL